MSVVTGIFAKIFDQYKTALLMFNMIGTELSQTVAVE